MKKILGLDLGTNSIGWALVENDFEKKSGKILDIGSRIIPMSQDILGKFESGQSISQTAERTAYRGTRRLYQRDTLRRERLHRILNILDFLPDHYKNDIDFEDKLGQFKEDKEPKINYRKNENGKYEFIFMDSFFEMVKEFEKAGQHTKIPYDWTIYFLRKKALKEKISKQELAWIILNFNQKRGYYQLRGEEEETSKNKEKSYEILIGEKAVENGDILKKTGEKLYDLYFTNGWPYDRPITKPEKWIGKEKEFIVTTTKTKSGETKRTFKAVNSEQDWIAIKEKTQNDIDNYNEQNNTVGVANYIFDKLLKNPNQKIRGKLIKTIERKYYKQELESILKKQIELQPELFTREKYQACIDELYPRNEAHKNNIKDKNFVYLFIDDIIFFQRPLKSKKSTIAGCQYEYRTYNKVDEQTGEIIKIKEPLKAISKSHPLYQEFRLWQFLKNLKIYKKEDTKDGKTKLDHDITDQLLKEEEVWVELFDDLNNRKEIEQKHILDFLVKKNIISKAQKEEYRWNYVEDKKYPANETRAQFLSRLKKVKNFNINKYDKKFETNLWHIIYSIKDKKQYEQALAKFASKNGIDEEEFVEGFKHFPPFSNNYGAYSEKALKKILPLMRRGKYWNPNDIPNEVKERISQYMEQVDGITVNDDHKDLKSQMSNVSNDNIPKQLVKSFLPFKGKNPLTGLNTYQACYAIYERHSEASEITKWNTPEDIDNYLQNFKQHSLRNPIVEQIVTETLKTVRDIWKKHGNFDEIHLELGRDLKNTAEKRQQITKKNIENENTNQRIKQLLIELMNDGLKEVRPYSQSQQEILKIYEEGIINNPDTKYEQLKEQEVEKIRKSSSPTSNDIKRYKLWLEQGYISPYTGQTIQLSKLFTENYQIEHIIPLSRYFDDSLSNKVICESEVNQLKGNQTAYEFIKNNSNRIVEIQQGKKVKIFSLEQYETHCKKYFGKNKTKLKKLLSEDIPDSFIDRQMNDSRYISKLIKGLLSNIVREEGEKDATSKNLIPIIGAITSRMKQDWGLNDIWNDIILPRFQRLNKILNRNDFTTYNSNKVLIPNTPDDIAKINKKRIDHRHHALDALVIALTSRKHIQYLNSLNNENIKYDLQPSLMVKNKEEHYTKKFKKPWPSFTTDAKEALEKTIISFKQNLRVINRTNNKTWQWVKQKNGQLKKQLVKQQGKNFAIRKPLHKETIAGKVKIRHKKTVQFTNIFNENYQIVDKKLKKKINELKEKRYDTKKIKKYFKDLNYQFNNKNVRKVEVYYFIEATASRTELTEKFTEKQLEKVTDSGIREILRRHANKYIGNDGKPQFNLAFNPEGIEKLNEDIVELNNGKPHKPIYKVRLYEEGNKFQLGEKGINSKKYAEAAKGTNLFFAIYWNDQKKKRVFDTIPLYDVIEHQKQQIDLPKKQRTPFPINAEKGKFLFYLSPKDLVYVPTDEEIQNPSLVDFNNLSKQQVDRIYKVEKFTGNYAFFIKNNVAKIIVDKKEFTSSNKAQKSIEGIMIKDRCWKLEVNRLGKITQVIR